MTEQEARERAEGLALCVGIIFYVVRLPGGDFQTVQIPPDGCEVVAVIAPRTSVHDQGLAHDGHAEPPEGPRGFE